MQSRSLTNRSRGSTASCTCYSNALIMRGHRGQPWKTGWVACIGRCADCCSDGDVAHMVERSLCMREVQGSIPCISKLVCFTLPICQAARLLRKVLLTLLLTEVTIALLTGKAASTQCFLQLLELLGSQRRRVQPVLCLLILYMRS